MNVEIRDERFRQVVGYDAPVEELAGGFDFTEGAVWNHVEDCLIFSDMPGNVMRKWTAADGIQVFRQPSNMANGNTYDLQGRLITCEHATSRVTRTEHDGSITVLATHYDGKELNSPNDVIVKSDGSIYFSDPSFGRMEYYGVLRQPELDVRGVYRLDPASGALRLLVDDFDQPNGLTFSLGERQLFINDTMRGHIRVFDVDADGGLSNGRVWAELTGDRDGLADGMKIDTEGNLYTAGPGGVQVFAPDATCLGVIYVPQGVANFTWGDADLRSLFINAGSSLYRTRVNVPGRKLF
ncbi:MAG: SMP-30/gluconolactonase/LRE family protein [Chloroflexota bacterium]|nr:SMP-30/gluconolactonase/LRE family protein [Chloroflexota bacterium]MDE2918633.1 SMP-30/gluconolactonase/LRE family protein [Chloroflexota bacterium]